VPKEPGHVRAFLFLSIPTLNAEKGLKKLAKSVKMDRVQQTIHGG
jgi:hypothetical protein